MKKPKAIARKIVHQARDTFPEATDIAVRGSRKLLRDTRKAVKKISGGSQTVTAPSVKATGQVESTKYFAPLDLAGETYTDEERVTWLQAEHAFLLEAHVQASREAERVRLETQAGEQQRLLSRMDASDVATDSSKPTIEAENPLDALHPDDFVSEYLTTKSSSPSGIKRLLVVSHNYPAEGNEYGGGFLHRRIKHYQSAGVHVDMLKLTGREPRTIYTYDDVNVMVSRGVEGARLVERGNYDAIAIHFPSSYVWGWLKQHAADNCFYFFIHGFEARRWVREIHNLTTVGAVQGGINATLMRQSFWRDVIAEPYGPMKYVFVSKHALKGTQDDMHVHFPVNRTAVIHNVIDTDLFTYVPKAAEQRFKVLWIRSAGNLNYGSDLAIAAMKSLQKRDIFKQLEFLIIGDGKYFPQFETAFAGVSNVKIEQRFASQEEIARLHKDYGIFLVPSRLDSQGVSRDEAMSSGLVPITNAVSAIPEFVDETCAMLADPEDAETLADHIEALASDAELFQRMSQAAAARVRKQTSPKHTIAKELVLMNLVDQEGDSA